MELFSHRYFRVLISVLVTLVCLYLVGLLRGFFSDIWAVLQVLVIPFVGALVVAYILRPVVELLVKRKVPRSVAILLIYFSFALFFVVVVMNLIPLLSRQVTELINRAPVFVHQADKWIDNLTAQKQYLPDSLRQGVEGAINQVETSITKQTGQILQMITSTVNAIFIAFVIPFLVFYMLKDARALGRVVVHLAPKHYQDDVKRVLIGIDEMLGRYVRGQLLIMLIVGILTYAGLLVIRMPYAITLASFMGIADLIPYIGSFIGAVPAVILALFISPQMAIKVLIVNIIVQQLEGNLVSPQIMGRTMDMHPMLIVAALLVAGNLGGVLGLIVAIPIVAVVKVVIRQVKEIREERLHIE
ncbi:AI-2E family transporter [Alicyclobacillus sp. SO9]|uniref:AI-2E family transporter n=1 Tax=Alicyclobacillus sp. SO9 TaxID=2665646 RepID=UPI001E479F8A|nr:AI-2E family transporter [Alicyclobacillus sp. SO9]